MPKRSVPGPPPQLSVFVLGTMRVEREGQALPLPGRKVALLLAYLVLNPEPDGHSREKLAALFWGDSPNTQARDSLRTALKSIRKLLGEDFILSDRDTVQINFTIPLRVDARELIGELETITSDRNSALTVPSPALDLYRGELLPDYYDDWVLSERERIRQRFIEALLDLAEIARARGNCVQAIELAKRVLERDPAQEPAHRHLIYCYHANGDRAAAIKQYQVCVRLLLDELAIAPSAETTALYESIKRESPEARALESRTSNLPVHLTSFVGREKEIKEIQSTLARTRLLTLTGAGGSGKTRLAIQAVADLLDEFRDGVWWVELAALSDGALMPGAIAKVLGVQQGLNQAISETLVHYLRPRQMLLALDNCEHLIDAGAQLAQALLSECPQLKILATSREAFDILGEYVYQVPTLSLPTNMQRPVHQVLEHEATRLFVERAHAVKSDFLLNEQNAFAIAQICARLDGIPLAIELAAARIKVLAPEEILTGLDDRFQLLTSGSRTSLPRQQTLRATLDWSYQLLTPSERILFRRLSVFAGGFTLEAAREVAHGDSVKRVQVLDLLSHLVDKSLALASASAPGAKGTRYYLLESIREYAREKLGEAEEETAVQNRLLEFFAGWVEEIEPNLEGSQQQVWLDRLELELDNLRACIDWAATSGDTLAALRLVGSLRRFWFIRAHHTEGLERSRTILAQPDTHKFAAARLKALNTLFFMLWPSGQIFDDSLLFEEAVGLATLLRDRRNQALALMWLGVNETNKENYAHARTVLEQSLDIWRELADSRYMGWTIALLGEVTLFEGDYSGARPLYSESVPPLRSAGDSAMLAIPLRRLGQLAMFAGELDAADELLKESLTTNWSVRDYRGVGASLAALADQSWLQGQTERAAKLFGVVDQLLGFIKTSLLRFDQQRYESRINELRNQLESSGLSGAWMEGRTMPLEQAIVYALETA